MMYELKFRLSNVSNGIKKQLSNHNQPKPTRPTSYFELRSAWFKVLSQDTLTDTEAQLIVEDLKDFRGGDAKLLALVKSVLDSNDAPDDFGEVGPWDLEDSNQK